jgi:uncharacterized protein (TIGR02266 family)
MSEGGQEKPQQPQGEPRRNLRSPLLVLRVRLDDGRKTFFGYAKNIGRGGIFIATVNPKEPGTRFQVEIPLPAPLCRNLQCFCEVVWKRDFSPNSLYEPGMGLKFIDLPDEHAVRIDQWVREVQG